MRTDVLSAISTDHCAFLWDGQKTLGKDDFSKIPNGGPGLENRLQMIHDFGVREGRISLNRMVELLATNPAKLFGLYPRKGTLAVGSDADIVVFDPEQAGDDLRVDAPLEVGLQPLRGDEVTGSPDVVLLRGRVSSRTTSSSPSRASASSSHARGSGRSCGLHGAAVAP